MTRPLLLLTRPDDEATRSVDVADAAGFDVLVAPLLHVTPLPFTVPDAPFDGLLFTSPRAPVIIARHAPELRAMPVLCVGPRTAEAARKAGFRVELAGETDGVAIVRAAFRQGYCRLLQPCGANRIDIPVPDGLTLHPIHVYQAVAADGLPADALSALAGGRLFATMLFSPRTARIFANLVDQAGLPRARHRLIALSPNVCTAAGPGWRSVATAGLPSLDAALAAAARLWQETAND